MSREIMNGDYYIGLDCGTESVGFAVTDTEYNILRAKGKSLWGVRLFDEASTAEERRMFRSARRRYMRRKERTKLLQSLFAEEIDKVDPGFLLRLNDSAYLREDKHIDQPNSLFNDKGYTDREYYDDYPTIYHLRKALIEGKAPKDIRLIYLAIHHIMKHRGHFLFEGKDFSSLNDLSETVSDIKDAYISIFDDEIEVSSPEELEEALKIKRARERQDHLEGIISCEKSRKSLIVKCLIGYKVKADKFFDNEAYSDLPEIKFSDSSFDEKTMPELEDNLDDDEYKLISLLKALYDWGLLANVMKGYTYLSESRVSQYEKNKEDLARLKRAIRLHSPKEYEAFFHDKEGKGLSGSYSQYTGSADGKAVRRCSTDDFYKTIRKLIGPDPEDEDSKIILEEIEDDDFLVLLSSVKNGVVPYQVHKAEMDRILEVYSPYFPFLTRPDAEGLTVIDKLDSIIEYKIPYYVGPLGRNDKGVSGWMVRKKDGKILPWNFSEMVDEDASAERFITNMTSKCTYLPCEDVIPKYSILYSSFMVLNELNILRINGQRLPVEQKQEIFRDLFLSGKKVTQKRLKEYVLSEGWYSKNEDIEISGIDGDFKSSMVSYRDFKPYFDSNKLGHKDAEDIIRWITLFSDGGDIVRRKIEAAFGDVLSRDEINRISRLRYSGWGRFSSRFLNGIKGRNKETGEEQTIIEALWTTKNNLGELLSSDYEYIGQTGDDSKLDKLDYSAVDSLYVSPSVKRQIWQTLKIVDELVKVIGKPPKKVFVETTRSKQDNPQRTVSRKKRLLDALSQLDDEVEIRELISQIESMDESVIARRDKLFLYFTQLGKCMYTGKPINLDEINNTFEYDIDHIYPYSKSDDDSLDNRVLVYQTENRSKSADYPLKDSIRKSMTPFWNKLLKLGLISEKKYARLIRTTPLDEEDEKGFINRQLVETSQTVKATINILKRYFGNDTAVVFSKASEVSKFRNENQFWKSRSINSLHHAKDAYLNIVVGNVLRTKYTTDFFINANTDNSGYFNISKPFAYDVVGAWIAGEDGTIATVRKYMDRNDILFTRQQREQGGGYFDQMPVSKGNGQWPRKPSDPVLLSKIARSGNRDKEYEEWKNRYGGYNKPTVSHFALISYKDKKKRVVRFIPISKLEAERFEDTAIFEKHCSEVLGYEDAKVIRKKILINTMLSINGFKCTLSGSSGGGVKFLAASAIPLLLSNEDVRSFNRIEKFLERKKNNKDLYINPEFDGITMENNLRLYDLLVDKAGKSIYKDRPSSQRKTFLDGRETFIGLSIEEQCSVLISMLSYFGMGKGLADLKTIGGSPNAGLITFTSKMETNEKGILIIDQSVTGLFENIQEIKA